MDPSTHDIPQLSTCTTCQAADDFSNYWTAVLYFKARNGTYKRVPQKGNAGFEGQKGGMTVYYMQNQLSDYEQKTKVTAFKPVRWHSDQTVRAPFPCIPTLTPSARVSACLSAISTRGHWRRQGSTGSSRTRVCRT